MNYDQNLVYLAQDAGAASYATDESFLAQLPFWIDAAEDRISRDMDLLNTYVEDDTGALSANRRLFTLPTDQGEFIALVTLRIVLPGPPQAPQPPLTWVSKEALDYMYPGDGAVGNPSVPKYVAPFNQLSVLVGPAPDQPYSALCFGTMRGASLNDQATLGSLSTGTFISNEMPDIFHAAQMIDVMAWQRQFSPSGDEAQGAQSWVDEYNRLIQSGIGEEVRKRLASQGWGSRQPSPIATPPQK